MGKIKKPLPVKLVIGFIFKENSIYSQAKALLEKRFAKIDFESKVMAFIYTDYYEKELGRPLQRRFVSFEKLIDPAKLSQIKIISNRLEKKLSSGMNRLINIDPGYLDLAKLLLATSKDYSHRIYLKSGIYAEVTLFYQDKTFKPQSWTYPDYKTAGYLAVFNRIRDIYARQIK